MAGLIRHEDYVAVLEYLNNPNRNAVPAVLIDHDPILRQLERNNHGFSAEDIIKMIHIRRLYRFSLHFRILSLKMIDKHYADTLDYNDIKRVAKRGGLEVQDIENHCNEVVCKVLFTNGEAISIPLARDGDRAKCALILLKRLLGKLPSVPEGLNANAYLHPGAEAFYSGLRARRILELKGHTATAQPNAPSTPFTWISWSTFLRRNGRF